MPGRYTHWLEKMKRLSGLGNHYDVTNIHKIKANVFSYIKVHQNTTNFNPLCSKYCAVSLQRNKIIKIWKKIFASKSFIYVKLDIIIRYCGHTSFHDDVIEWKHFPRYWPFVRGIHWSPVNSPHKGQWRRALMLSLICTWINGWANNREAGDLRRRHRVHYDVMLMFSEKISVWVPGKCHVVGDSNRRLGLACTRTNGDQLVSWFKSPARYWQSIRELRAQPDLGYVNRWQESWLYSGH